MKETQMSMPDLFRCPISLDLFKDPVTLCTGQTYDRSSIEKWLTAGNLTCPVTMQKLHDPTLVPNHTLRHLIHRWLEMGGRFNPQDLEKINSLASLKHDLESIEATFLHKQHDLERLQALLTGETPSRESCSLGFLPVLLNLVFRRRETRLTQDYFKLVETALSCIVRLLSLGESEPLNMLKEESNIESFVGLYGNGTSTIKKCLCHVIEAISSCSDTKELCAKLGEHKRLLGGVIAIIDDDTEASESGIKAISGLCSLESNRENLIKEGVVNTLLKCISNSEKHSIAPVALTIIKQLLGHEQAKDELINDTNGIISLVKMVFRVSDHEGSESAVDALMIVCCDSSRAREEAVEAGILTQLLLLLQSQCNGRTKTKARMLLKMLRSK